MNIEKRKNPFGDHKDDDIDVKLHPGEKQTTPINSDNGITKYMPSKGMSPFGIYAISHRGYYK